MCRLILSLFALGLAAGLGAQDLPRPATADETELFKEAMRNSAQDTEHWAYTETRRENVSKRRERGETIVRFDPSKPYPEQFTPLKVEGKPPTEKHLNEYRKRGEKRGERIRRLGETAGKTGAAPPPQLKIGGSSVTLDLEHPRFVRAEEGRTVFEVPAQTTRKDIPIDKFQILVVVGRESRVVQNVSLHLRESFRVKLVAKVKAGGASLDLAVIDPGFGPVITRMSGDFSLSLMLMPVNAKFERTRAEWQRVKSFDERLQVKLGPLQFLDS